MTKKNAAKPKADEVLAGSLEDELQADLEAADAAEAEGIVLDPRTEEAIEAGKRNPQADAMAALELAAAEDEAESRAPTPKAILRPSELSKMIERHAQAHGLEIKDIDPYKFRRERGLPNPIRRYRVTGLRGTKDGPIPFPAIEVEAVDESEACLRALNRANVPGKERHRWQLRTVTIAE